jgi:hypothetical protein
MSDYFHEIAKRNSEIGEIKFSSIATGETISFPAFITNFNDNFTIGFGGETTFGRNDPVKHYQSTSRTIQAAFDIVGVNEEQAIDNFRKYGKLIQMCYPVYSSPIGNSNNARTIKAPPLWRIKYANYISSPTGAGLLGALSGMSFNPDFRDKGHFITKNNKLIPIIYSLSINFQPLHEVPLGFDQNGNFLAQGFPYGYGNSNTQGPIKP